MWHARAIKFGTTSQLVRIVQSLIIVIVAHIHATVGSPAVNTLPCCVCASASIV